MLVKTNHSSPSTNLERSRLRRRLLSRDLDRPRRLWRDDGERERLLLRLLGERDLDL